MKKLFVALISAVLCFSLFALVGCGKNKATTTETSPDMCEIGYQVDVYPAFAFDYLAQLNEESYTVHIETITVTLIEKNTINADEVVTGRFYPYSFQIVVKAQTASGLAGRQISIRLLRNDTLTMMQSSAAEDGTIEWSQIWNTTMSIPKVSFSDIILYEK